MQIISKFLSVHRFFLPTFVCESQVGDCLLNFMVQPLIKLTWNLEFLISSINSVSSPQLLHTYTQSGCVLMCPKVTCFYEGTKPTWWILNPLFGLHSRGSDNKLHWFKVHTQVQTQTETHADWHMLCVNHFRRPVGIAAIKQTRRESALMLTDLGSLPTTARFRGIFRNGIENQRFFSSSAGCWRADGMVVKMTEAHLQKTCITSRVWL